MINPYIIHRYDATMSQECHYDPLPFDVKTYLASFLPLEDELNFSLVSKETSRMIGDYGRWRTLCMKAGIVKADTDKTTFRENFVRQLKEKNPAARWRLINLNNQFAFNYSSSTPKFLEQVDSILKDAKLVQEQKEDIVLKCYRLLVSDELLPEYMTTEPRQPFDLFYSDLQYVSESLDNNVIFKNMTKNKQHIIEFYHNCDRIFFPVPDGLFEDLEKDLATFHKTKNDKLISRTHLALGKCLYYSPNLEKETNLKACEYFRQVRNSPYASRRDKNCALFYELTLFFHNRCQHFNNDTALQKLLDLDRISKLPCAHRNWVNVRLGIMQYENATATINGALTDEQAHTLLKEANIQVNYGPTALEVLQRLYTFAFEIFGRVQTKADSSITEILDIVQADLQENQFADKDKAIAQFVLANFMYDGEYGNHDMAKHLYQQIVNEKYLKGREEEAIAKERLKYYESGEFSSYENESDIVFSEEELEDNSPESKSLKRQASEDLSFIDRPSKRRRLNQDSSSSSETSDLELL